MMTMVTNEDHLPHVLLYGSSANLAGLRLEESRSEFLGQRNNNDNDNNNDNSSIIMDTPIPCRLKWGDEEVEGLVIVLSCQVCFVEGNPTPSNNAVGGGGEPRDLAIGATCITLHAMTEEPELAIYLQLSEHNNDADYNYNNNTNDNDDNDNDDDQNVLAGSATSEVTIIPSDPDASQTLFDALCKLVSRHPLDLDDDDEDDGGMMGAFGDDSDEVIWAPSGGFVDGEEQDVDGDGGGAERMAMLDKLDNMLVVDPEFEIHDGQFDDADEE